MDRYRKEVIQVSTQKNDIKVQYLYNTPYKLCSLTIWSNKTTHTFSKFCLLVLLLAQKQSIHIPYTSDLKIVFGYKQKVNFKQTSNFKLSHSFPISSFPWWKGLRTNLGANIIPTKQTMTIISQNTKVIFKQKKIQFF